MNNERRLLLLEAQTLPPKVKEGEEQGRFILNLSGNGKKFFIRPPVADIIVPGLNIFSEPADGPYCPHVLTLAIRSTAHAHLRLHWNAVLVKNIMLKTGFQEFTVRINSYLIQKSNHLTIVLVANGDDTAFPQLDSLVLEGGVDNKQWALRHFKQANGREANKDLSSFNDVIFHRQMELWERDLSAYTDKLRLRDLVARAFGERYLVPIQGIYASPQEIDWQSLVYPCVIKSNHASGQVLRLDAAPTSPPLDMLTNWLRQDYTEFGEPCYRGITPRLYVEDCLNPDGAPLIDYKFHCFGGKAKSIAVILGRPETGKPCMTHYSPQWEPQRFTISNDLFTGDVPRPAELEEMLHIAETLAAPFKYVRVDLYDVAGKIYVGELTFFHYGGVGKISSPFWDRWLAECYHSVSKSELL